jgi:NADH-quinone oxidoreductase subunit G
MPGRVNVTIDGRQVEAEAGDLVIKVAQDHGVYIPRFCWHERMKPVGMCRMCLVEIEGQRGLPPACTATVADGMVVTTTSPAVKKAQEGVLEFLLINHPLDCPVCDRGGECPLQDLTFGYGPGESRFVEEKRHFAKPLPISDLVLLDRERCILCARCTRFADEVAGDPLITFVERGGDMQVLTFPDEPFTSYFSGNTVQICPVGALLAAPYRFRARPWDLSSVESSCQACAVGCRAALQSSSNRLVRALGVDSEAVNHGWLCDKGRFGFDFVHAEGRWTEPMVRDASGQLVEAAWPDALDAAAAGLGQALAAGGPESVAVLGGARGTNEDAYAWARLAKGVLRTDNVDCQLGDGLPAEIVAGLPRATLADCDTARAIVLLAPDPREELPVAFLRLRRAVVDLGVPLIELTAAPTGLTRHARVSLHPAPGEVAVMARRLAEAVATGTGSGDLRLDSAAHLLAGGEGQPGGSGVSPGGGPGGSGVSPGGGGHIVVVLGRPNLAEPAAPTVAAATALAHLPGVRFLSALRRGNVHGALDAGLAPGVLPGRVGLDAGRSWFEAAWGGVPAARGLDAEGILRAAADGRIGALVLLGADPVSDFPEADLARRAVERVAFVVAVDAYPTASSRPADVVLPVAIFGEKRGSSTNLEGRLLRLARKVTPPGTAMEDWRVAAELAVRLGSDFDLEAVDEVTDEIAALAPSHGGADAALLRRALDGVVVPVGDREAPALDQPAHAISPIADPEPANVGGPVEALSTTGIAAAGAGLVASPVAEAAMATISSRTPRRPSGSPPPTLRWEPGGNEAEPAVPSGPGFGVSPLANTGGLRLVAFRRLYDAGVAVSRSGALAQLAAAPAVGVAPEEADHLGLAEGDQVTVSSPRGTVTLPLRVDPGLARGIATVPFNPAGPGAGELIDVSAVTEVRLELARPTSRGGDARPSSRGGNDSG